MLISLEDLHRIAHISLSMSIVPADFNLTESYLQVSARATQPPAPAIQPPAVAAH